jgi:thymidylate synthase ThyX
VCEYAVFRNLQRHRMVDDLEWQQLSPRFGYEVPKVIEDAGLTDTFERGFDLSLRLFSALQQAGYPLEAQYATLQGHKMRWKVTVNAREAMHITELYMNPQGNPAYQHIVRQMYEKLANRHPLLAEAMRFATQPETDEMILQAAERYNQFKLSL